MTLQDRIDCLYEAWEDASKTSHSYLTTSEKAEMFWLLDRIQEICNDIERMNQKHDLY